MGVRTYPATPRVYFDMDGPLADFEKGANDRGISMEVMKLIAGTYANLPVTEGAKAAVKAIIEMGFEPWVMTKIPRENPYAATEKLLWLQREFPEFGEHVHITPDKGDPGREIDILIDDHPEWANANNFKGSILTFKFDWDATVKQVMEIAKSLTLAPKSAQTIEGAKP